MRAVALRAPRPAASCSGVDVSVFDARLRDAVLCSLRAPPVAPPVAPPAPSSSRDRCAAQARVRFALRHPTPAASSPDRRRAMSSGRFPRRRVRVPRPVACCPPPPPPPTSAVPRASPATVGAADDVTYGAAGKVRTAIRAPPVPASSHGGASGGQGCVWRPNPTASAGRASVRCAARARTTRGPHSRRASSKRHAMVLQLGARPGTRCPAAVVAQAAAGLSLVGMPCDCTYETRANSPQAARRGSVPLTPCATWQ